MVVRIVKAGLLVRTVHNLKVMSVQVERMLSGIVVVQHDLDDLVLGENEGVGVTTVDSNTGGSVTGSKGSVKGRDLWSDVGNIVEKGAGMLVDGLRE